MAFGMPTAVSHPRQQSMPLQLVLKRAATSRKQLTNSCSWQKADVDSPLMTLPLPLYANCLGTPKPTLPAAHSRVLSFLYPECSLANLLPTQYSLALVRYSCTNRSQYSLQLRIRVSQRYFSCREHSFLPPVPHPFAVVPVTTTRDRAKQKEEKVVTILSMCKLNNIVSPTPSCRLINKLHFVFVEFPIKRPPRPFSSKRPLL